MICSQPWVPTIPLPPVPTTWNGKNLRFANPQQLAEKLGIPRPETLYFIPSPVDYLTFIQVLSLVPEDSYFVFSEVDPRLAEISFAQFSSLSAQPERFFWLGADTEQDIKKITDGIPWQRIRRVVLLTLGNSWLPHAARYRQIETRLADECTVYWMNRSTALGLGALWVQNIFKNLMVNAPSMRGWPHWGKDPVVVVGAGTSVESLVPWLRSASKTMRVLAADTALNFLHETGCNVDAAVCLESQQVNLKDFQAYAQKKLPVFLDLTAHPSTPRILGGEVYPFYSRIAPLTLMTRLAALGFTEIPALGSVGVAAVYLALQLTHGPVILCGLDFAFPSGKTHVKDSPSLVERRMKADRTHSLEIPGIWAQPSSLMVQGLHTTRIMSGYARSLENLVVPGADRIINLCQGLDFGLEKHQPPGPDSWGISLKVPGDSRPFFKSPAALEGFFQEENRNLTSFFLALEKINQGGNTPQTQEQLLGLAKNLDHLYFNFPDTQPMPRFDTGFLSRLLMTARWHQQRLVPWELGQKA